MTGSLLKGFNDTVKNLKVGEKNTIALKAKDAYGEYIDEAIITVKKTELSSRLKI